MTNTSARYVSPTCAKSSLSLTSKELPSLLRERGSFYRNLLGVQDGTVIVDIKAYPFTGDGKVSGDPKTFQVKGTAVDETKVP